MILELIKNVLNIVTGTIPPNWQNPPQAEKRAVVFNDPIISDVTNKKFVPWVKNRRVTSPFQEERNLYGKKQAHLACDYVGETNEVFAPCDGVIQKILMPDYAYPVSIELINGKIAPKTGVPKNRAWTPYLVLVCGFDSSIIFCFKHTEAMCTVGQGVKAGQLISKYGDWGYSLGAHVHSEVIVDNKYVDPEKFLKEHGI